MSTTQKPPFSRDIIKLKNLDEVVDSICTKLKEDIGKRFRRRGAVLGISGGIDSSVCLALTVKALGAKNVLGVLLPESDSSPESKDFALVLAEKFGIETIEENISGALEGFGCYSRRDEAVKRVIPEYNPEEDKMKIVIPEEIIKRNLPPVHYVTVIFKDGSEKSVRLPINEYLQIVAASNFKQRSRMTMLYYHSESLHRCVVGTPNKHEVQQGFFVKYGDSGADVMPISNLYKTQVYQLAEHLGVPQIIIDRTPTSDTYPAEQTQEEFFFQMSFEEMDLYWYGWENGYSAKEVAPVMKVTEEDVERIYKNFERKKQTTEFLRTTAVHEYYGV